MVQIRKYIDFTKFSSKDPHGTYVNPRQQSTKIKKPKINRIAAFQFKEMTISSWNKLSLEKKSLWYYKKTRSKYVHIDSFTSIENKSENKKKVRFSDENSYYYY